MQEAGIELPRLTVLALQLLLIWWIRVLVWVKFFREQIGSKLQSLLNNMLACNSWCYKEHFLKLSSSGGNEVNYQFYFMRGMTYLFLGMSRRGLVLVYYFLLWYRLSSIYGAVLLIVNTFIATGHICFARTKSEHACYAAARRSFPARLLILKGNALHLFENKCIIVGFQCTIHSAPRLLLLAKICLDFGERLSSLV